jgi:hypothetical protein
MKRKLNIIYGRKDLALAFARQFSAICPDVRVIRENVYQHWAMYSAAYPVDEIGIHAALILSYPWERVIFRQVGYKLPPHTTNVINWEYDNGQFIKI